MNECEIKHVPNITWDILYSFSKIQKNRVSCILKKFSHCCVVNKYFGREEVNAG